MLNLRGRLLSLERPLVMGILNTTPDSFYSNSRISPEASDLILQRASTMIRQGASILDIGGYSTRPGALEDPKPEEEINRVVPVISLIRTHFPDIAISIDTFRAEVAQAAVEAGADIVNDVSGGNLDDKMFDTVAQLNVPYILMHMRGTPQTMGELTDYPHFPDTILRELGEKLDRLRRLGLKDVIIDPGFGLPKTPDQNFGLLAYLSLFRELGCPILVGVSRKSTITRTLGIPTEEALNGTTVLNTIALMNGASILRVHDVLEAKQAIVLTECVKKFDQ